MPFLLYTITIRIAEAVHGWVRLNADHIFISHFSEHPNLASKLEIVSIRIWRRAAFLRWSWDHHRDAHGWLRSRPGGVWAMLLYLMDLRPSFLRRSEEKTTDAARTGALPESRLAHRPVHCSVNSRGRGDILCAVPAPSSRIGAVEWVIVYSIDHCLCQVASGSADL
jgi:hypothetical protein